MNQLLTVSEAASRLAVSPITLRRWIADGRADSVKMGRSVRLSEAEIERLIRDHTRRLR